VLAPWSADPEGIVATCIENSVGVVVCEVRGDDHAEIAERIVAAINAAPLEEARAAVTELIERAQETVERFEDDYDMADLRAALARVQGGQS